MDVVSLGHRTDLALLELGGSTVTDRGDHLVIRSPDNPTFWWGNFILLARPPAVSAVQRWLDTFATEFPGAQHVAIGLDHGGHHNDALLADLRGREGFTVEISTVMTATSVHPPARPHTDAVIRPLDVERDDDWTQSVEVRMAVDADAADAADATGTDHSTDDPGHREFVVARAATARELCRAGHGSWFGAFLGGQLVSQLGLVRAGEGLARFQSVETHPDFRSRGLAGTLVHHASQIGFRDLGATTLVMVANPDYLAIRIYASVGFADTETQLQVTRRPLGLAH